MTIVVRQNLSIKMSLFNISRDSSMDDGAPKYMLDGKNIHSKINSKYKLEKRKWAAVGEM